MSCRLAGDRRIRPRLAVWPLLLLVSALSGCDSEKATRYYGPTGTPTMIGQWRGTVTAWFVSGSDTLSVVTNRTRFTFDDSTFSYYHIDDFGAIIQPFRGAGFYEVADNRMYLQDTTTYDEWVDRTPAPVTAEPYERTLTHTALVMVWSHDYGQGVVRSQRIDLIPDR